MEKQHKTRAPGVFSASSHSLLSHLLAFIPPNFCFISNTSNSSTWEARNPLIYDQPASLQLGQSLTLTMVPGLGLNPGSEGKVRALPPALSRQGEQSLQAEPCWLLLVPSRWWMQSACTARPASGEHTAGCCFRGAPFHLKRAIKSMFYFGRLLNRFHQGDLPHCFITW